MEIRFNGNVRRSSGGELTVCNGVFILVALCELVGPISYVKVTVKVDNVLSAELEVSAVVLNVILNY